MAGAELVRARGVAPAIARIDADVVLEDAILKSRVVKLARRPDLKALLTVPHNVSAEGHIDPTALYLIALHSDRNVVDAREATVLNEHL